MGNPLCPFLPSASGYKHLLMSGCAPRGFKRELADSFPYIKTWICDSPKISYEITFEVNNKMTAPFSVTEKCSLAARELTEKDALLAYTLLITSCLDMNVCGFWGQLAFHL